MSFRDDVHQAVNIGFGIADLLGGGFGGFDDAKHVLHTDASGSSLVTLSLNGDTQPVISCTGPSTTYAVVVPTTTQAQNAPIDGDVTAQPLIVQGGQQILFDNFPSFTKGMLTATQIDTTQPNSSPQLIAAATLRNFSDAQAVPLTTVTDANGDASPVVSLSAGSSSFTVYNADPSNSYAFVATITTSSPNQTLTFPGLVEPGNSTTTQFPAGVESAVIAQLTMVVSATAGGSYTFSTTPGSYPIPS